jgi:TolB-like protein
MRATHIVAALVALASVSSAQDSRPASAPERPRLAVIDFAVKGDVGIAEAGEVVAELLLTRYPRERFQPVERSQLAALLKEVDLTLAIVRDNPEKIYGKLKGVKYIVLGSVNKLGNISITARMVEVATGDIIQTAEVSAEDARGLQDALTELASKLSGGEAVKGPSSAGSGKQLDLELEADYGTVVVNRVETRLKADGYTLFEKLPAGATLRYYPDSKFGVYDKVKTTVGLTPTSGPAIPAGATGEIQELIEDKDGRLTCVVTFEDRVPGGKVSVARRHLQPAVLPVYFEDIRIDADLAARGRLRCLYIARTRNLQAAGNGVTEYDGSALTAEQQKEVGRIGAAVDALRQLSERALHGQSDSTKLGDVSVSKFRGEVMGISLQSVTTVNNWVVESDVVEAILPVGKGGVTQISFKDFVVEKPESIAGKGIWDQLLSLMKSKGAVIDVKETDKTHTVTVTVGYSGLFIVSPAPAETKGK